MVFEEKGGEHGHGSRGARKEAGRRPVRPIKASPHDRPIIHHIPSTRRAVLKMASAGLPTHMQFLIKRSIKSCAHQTELQGPCSGCFSKNSFHVHPMRPCRPLFAICCPPGRPPPPPARRLLHSYSSTGPNYNCFLHSYSSTGPMHNCFLHSYSLTARTIIAFCIPILKQVPAIIVSAFLFFNRSQL